MNQVGTSNPSSVTNEKSWIRVTFESTNAEEILYDLMNEGGEGGELLDQHRAILTIYGDEAAQATFSRRITEEGGTIQSIECVQLDNWVAHCQTLWAPVRIGRLVIEPVSESETYKPSANSPRSKDQEILLPIIPGMGFGTGHHETTRLILSLMQELVTTPPKHVLDVGTGSGILAIASAKLWQCPVDALDIDPLALANAEENARLNAVTPLVRCSLTPLSEITEVYPLVIANLYAELLVTLSPLLTERTALGGQLIVSGIMESLIDSVTDVFNKPHWNCLTVVREGQWAALVLARC